MSINLNINGIVYPYPEVDDVLWGENATAWAQAVTVGMLQKAGGLFQLLAEVDFGTAAGIKTLYMKSRATNPATAGVIRLGNADKVSWRNDANLANLDLGVDVDGNLTFGGEVLPVGLITNADIAADAAIAFTKMEALTLSRAIVSDLSGHLAVSSVTQTELEYLDGVTSSVQDQLDAKLARSGGTMTGDINMDTNNISNLPTPVDPADAATKNYVDGEVDLVAQDLNDFIAFVASTYLALAGGTMSGPIAMGSNAITGLPAPSNPNDAARKTYVDTADALKLNLTGGTMSGVIAMGNNQITGLATPTNPADAVTKQYVDSLPTGGDVSNGGNTFGSAMSVGTNDNFDFSLRSYNTTQLTFTNTTMTFVLPALGPNGSNSLPAYAFSSDPDTGLYRVGANNLGFATAATAAGDIDANQRWTIGNSSGTQTHLVNGRLQVTNTSTAVSPMRVVSAVTALNNSGGIACIGVSAFKIGVASSGGGGIPLIFSRGGTDGFNTDSAQFDASGNFFPGADNAQTLGANGSRWSVVWAATGTINTSDARAKKNVKTTPLGLDFINRQQPVSYEFIDEKLQGVYHGLIAQHVEESLAGEPFAGLIKPEDEKGQYGLNYSEFIAPLINSVQELTKLVADLKQKVEFLENRVSHN